MAKRKRAKKEEPKEEARGGNWFEKIKPYFEKYGYLFAFAGAVPLISGWLLFNEKECGCFLLPKSTLEANNELWGLISIVAGLVLLLPAIFQYNVIGKHKRKDWKIRYEYLVSFILAVGIAWFYIGLETQPGVTADADGTGAAGEFDELTTALTDNDWILFYGNKCPACHTQFEMLGDSVKYLRIFDCGTFECPTFIEATPSWYRAKPDGSVEIKKGVQSIETLHQMAGLEAP